jgi:hypothetical protein
MTDDDDDLTFETCIKESRSHRAYFFKLDEAVAVFNYGRDRVTLEHSFLGKYARGAIKEGDPLAVHWEKVGWTPLGERVSWRLTPHALEFSLASGHKYQLRREALRAWMDHDDGWHFPGLEDF